MKNPFRVQRRWTALALVLLAGMLVLLLIRGGRQPSKTPGAESLRAPPIVIRPRPESSEAHATTQPVARSLDASAAKDELCGVSASDALRAGNETIDQHVARLTEPALGRWKSSLAASEDPRRQAMALALANAKPGPGPRPGAEPSRDTPVNNSLVLLAMQTDDPAIYALALHQCLDDDYAMSPGPCEALSFEHWTAIAPDNAIPWLWRAARANRAGDAEGVEAALAKASAAAGIGEDGAGLYMQAMAAFPGDASPLEKAAAGTEIDSILPGGAPIELISLCSEAAIQQPLRKKQCASIATALATEGSTLFDLVLAARLGDRVGSPEDTRKALSKELANAHGALTGTPNPWSTSGPDPWAGVSDAAGFRCGTVRRYNAFVDAIQAARGNERAALASVSRTLQGAR